MMISGRRQPMEESPRRGALAGSALAGESGGGPFTLAAAHALADRVSVVALIASGGPIAPAEMNGMKTRIRVMVWLARHAPTLNTIQVAVMRRELISPARRERSLQ